MSLFNKKEKFDSNGSIYSIAWRKFIYKPLNIFFLIVLICISAFSILGYLITPDSTPYANKQNLELTLQKPGFKIDFIKIPKDNNNN
jgi:peptide/nickel transport system permease protein